MDLLAGEGTALASVSRETSPARPVDSAARLTVPHRNLGGATSLPVLGAVIARLSVLVTNDTGPAHIAYALATPSVTVFGGADPAANPPPPTGRHVALVHPVPCRPPGGVTCTDCPYGYACLEGAAVEAVVEAATPRRERPVDLGRRGVGAAPDGTLTAFTTAS